MAYGKLSCKIILTVKLLLNLNEDKYRCMINAANVYVFLHSYHSRIETTDLRHHQQNAYHAIWTAIKHYILSTLKYSHLLFC